MLEVLNLLRRINADLCFELLHCLIGSGSLYSEHAAICEAVFQHRGQSGKIVDLFAGEPEGFNALAVFELQLENAHADQVGAMNALEAFRDHRAHPEQIRPFRSPVA